ncbi:MAG: ATP-binding protein, partial [Patescibacteria group bacterium]|nr:ATP-binding protein [Patescibacteria group bacterium]
MDHLFDMRPTRPGFRLQRVEVLNWGTFDSTDGQVYRFEPKGRTSLLVGHNGSGKSTLVDAILTLIVEPRTRNYNVAAGARKTERTEKSYIRGAFDRTSDEAQATVVKYLRPKGTHLTALAAVFRDEQLDRAFTVCQVLYLTADDSDKVYAIADEARCLKTDLAGIRSSDAIRSHLQSLGYETTKTFVQYHGWLTKRTKMRAKAADMFNQTVAVKDIQSLNEFIRQHMLETHDWREKVQRLLTHFNDLSVAHQELVRARRADELLTPVEKRGIAYRELSRAMEAGQRQLEAADLFFREETVRLFGPEIDRHEAELAGLVARIERLAQETDAVSRKVRQLQNDIDQAGGDRLRAIPALLEVERTRLESKRRVFERYHSELRRCEIPDIVATLAAFQAMRPRLQTLAKTNADAMDSASGAHEALIGNRGAIRGQASEERAELAVLAQRQTNLPPRLTALRSRLCEDLQLGEDALPFAAELMAVDPAERRWEASAEMVLRAFALSLLVPDRYYRRVRAYV